MSSHIFYVEKVYFLHVGSSSYIYCVTKRGTTNLSHLVGTLLGELWWLLHLKKPGKILWLNVIPWNPMQPYFSFTNKKNIRAYFIYLICFILFRPACRLHSFALHSNSIFWSSMFLSSSFFAVAPRIKILHFCLSHFVKSQLSFHEILFTCLAKKIVSKKTNVTFNYHQVIVKKKLSSSKLLYYFVSQSSPAWVDHNQHFHWMSLNLISLYGPTKTEQNQATLPGLILCRG